MNQPPAAPPPAPAPMPPRSGWRTFGLVMLWIFAIIGFGATLCTATFMFAGM